jgi:hypothetical protein
VANCREVASLSLLWIPRAIAFSPAQHHLFCTANLNGTLTLFDLNALK